MTHRPNRSPRRGLTGITFLSSLVVLPATGLAQDTEAATDVAADPLTLAAEDAASCRELRDTDIRLACLDRDHSGATQGRAGRDAVDPPIAPIADTEDAQAAPVAAAAPPAAMAPATPAAVPATPAANASATTAPAAAVEPSREASEQPPDWAAAPRRPQRDVEQDEIPKQFEATIVRITRNNVGRHRFYTADGAVWEQTQLVDVRQPDSLPAVAQFRRKLTGNPTIKFDVSSRSYRVRRIE